MEQERLIFFAQAEDMARQFTPILLNAAVIISMDAAQDKTGVAARCTVNGLSCIQEHDLLSLAIALASSEISASSPHDATANNGKISFNDPGICRKPLRSLIQPQR